MKASVAIQTLPAAPNDQELVRIVDEVIDYIKSTGLAYYVGPFETAIEGDDYDQLMDVVKECQHIAIRAGAPSVSAYIKVTYRPEGEVLTIDLRACVSELANKLLHEFDVIVSAYGRYEFHRVLLVVGSSTARFAMD